VFFDARLIACWLIKAMPSFGKNENVIIDQGSAWTAEICSSKNPTMLPRAAGTGGR